MFLFRGGRSCVVFCCDFNYGLDEVWFLFFIFDFGVLGFWYIFKSEVGVCFVLELYFRV